MLERAPLLHFENFSRRQFLRTLSLLPILTLPGSGVCAQKHGQLPGPHAAETHGGVLRVGIMPYLSVVKLLAGHQGLRMYLEQNLRRPAELSTAKTFALFQEYTLAGQYALNLAGPPLAWEAYRSGSMEPVAVATSPFRLHIAVGENSSLRTLSDLRGKYIGSLPPPSFVPTILTEALRDHGLRVGENVHLVYDSVAYNLALKTLMQEIDAVAYPNIILPSLPGDLLRQLRTIHVTPDFPSMIFSARRHSDSPPPAALQRLLLEFAQNAAGRRYVDEFGHGGLRAPNFEQLQALDRFLPKPAFRR